MAQGKKGTGPRWKCINPSCKYYNQEFAHPRRTRCQNPKCRKWLWRV